MLLDRRASCGRRRLSDIRELAARARSGPATAPCACFPSLEECRLRPYERLEVTCVPFWLPAGLRLEGGGAPHRHPIDATPSPCRIPRLPTLATHCLPPDGASGTCQGSQGGLEVESRDRPGDPVTDGYVRVPGILTVGRRAAVGVPASSPSTRRSPRAAEMRSRRPLASDS